MEAPPSQVQAGERGAVKLAKGSGVGVGSNVAEAGSVDTVTPNPHQGVVNAASVNWA